MLRLLPDKIEPKDIILTFQYNDFSLGTNVQEFEVLENLGEGCTGCISIKYKELKTGEIRVASVFRFRTFYVKRISSSCEQIAVNIVKVKTSYTNNKQSVCSNCLHRVTRYVNDSNSVYESLEIIS